MRRAVIGLMITALVSIAALAGCAPAGTAPAPSTVSAVPAQPLGVGPGAAPSTAPVGSIPAGADALSIGTGAVDTTGGSLPDGLLVSPFDVENPVVGLLEPSLRAAVQDAVRAAAADGVDVRLTSGWRSRGFQQRLFADAVTTYGSAAAANRFVASPDTSMHVRGMAVDVGPTTADDWMIRNGPRFGLCQIYANEIWHFELARDAQGNCPPLRPDAAG